MNLEIINYIDNYVYGLILKYNKIHFKFIKKVIFNLSNAKTKKNIYAYYNTNIVHDINMYYSMIYFINKNNYENDDIHNLSFHNFNNKFISKFNLNLNNNSTYSNLQINIIAGIVERIDIEMITNTQKEYKCIHKNISNLQLNNKSGDIDIIFNKLDDIIIQFLYKYFDTKLLEGIL